MEGERMGKYMTPEDATLAGNYSEWDEDDEVEAQFDYCEECNNRVYDSYCDECEEYLD
jgi:hypothetical protein